MNTRKTANSFPGQTMQPIADEMTAEPYAHPQTLLAAAFM
jgi:hypothetical protein